MCSFSLSFPSTRRSDRRPAFDEAAVVGIAECCFVSCFSSVATADLATITKFSK
jgi:hypothetical protein